MNRTSKFVVAGLLVSGLAVGSTLAFAGKNNASQIPLETSLTIAQVSEIALNAKPGVIEEIELEREDGKVVFEVEIETEYSEFEVVIDANSGEVLEIEEEDDKLGWFKGDDDDQHKSGNGRN